jgi:hypothetical protein
VCSLYECRVCKNILAGRSIEIHICLEQLSGDYEWLREYVGDCISQWTASVGSAAIEVQSYRLWHE